MSTATAKQIPAADSLSIEATKQRSAATGDTPEVLANLYEDDINIAIWQRPVNHHY